MKLSAPVHRLKRRARLLSRQENIPLHAALDRIASGEGFRTWGLLAAKAGLSAAEIFARLRPGDTVLLGARPGHGKTLMSLRLAAEAMKAGSPAYFFTLEYTERDVRDRFEVLGFDGSRFGALFRLDASDAVSAGHIADALAAAPRGTLAVVDYLQLLDQKRTNPPLAEQVRLLRGVARERGVVFVFISQIDRAYDPSRKPVPDMEDIRLPNPLDLSLFSKMCFLNEGEVRFRQSG